MSMPPIPVSRYLVPSRTVVDLDDYAVVDVDLVRGLPHTIDLGDDQIVLSVPTGLARLWHAANPEVVVSSSVRQTAAYDDAAPPRHGVARAPARLLVRIGGSTTASLALAAGEEQIVGSDADNDDVRLSIVVRSWDLRAGSLRGPGDYGSRISLAWRRVDQAVDEFSTPPIKPTLVPRLAPLFRMHSILGLRQPFLLNRFTLRKKVFRK